MILHIGSLNVHNLEAGEERLDDIIRLIDEHKLDIVCFQEMTRNGHKQMIQKTGMNGIYWFGNLLISKLTILESKNIKLPKFRGALMVTLEDNDKNRIKVMLTHLDHLFESNRMAQFDVFKRYLNDIDFLIGDFNSVYRNDYSKSKAKQLNKAKILANKEEFKYSLIDAIMGENFMINPFILQTCPYGTRIDYIFFKGNFMKKNKINNKIDKVIDTIATNISDHNMIITKMY